MAENPDQGIPTKINVNDLNALINKMLGELVAGQQAMTPQEQNPGAPQVYSFTINFNGSGIEISDAKQKAEPQQKMEVREPLVDVIENAGLVTVIAEIAGSEKQSVVVSADSARLSIKAQQKNKQYSKVVQLPSPVNPKGAKATYLNGVLEIVLKKSPSYKGAEMKIEIA